MSSSFQAFFFVFTLGFSLLGCMERTPKSRGELYRRGVAVDSKLEVVTGVKAGEWGSCLDYGEGCVETLVLSHRGVLFVCVLYDDPQMALAFAQLLGAYVVGHWLLDHVKGEPVLEKFAGMAWGAKRVEKELKKAPPSSVLKEGEGRGI